MNIVPMFAATELKHALAVMIPIVAIIMGLAIPIIAIISDYLRKRHIYELHHKERLAAIEKGMEVPPLPEALLGHSPKLRRPQDYFRHGLIWTFLGISVCFALNSLMGPGKQWLGLPLVAIGLAFLCYYFFVGRHQPEEPAQDAESKRKSTS